MLKSKYKFQSLKGQGHALDDGEFSKVNAILSVNPMGIMPTLSKGYPPQPLPLCMIALMCKLQLVVSW